MARTLTPTLPAAGRPTPGAVLELFKPITWFPPMWAFGCGVVSAGTGGADLASRWPAIALGIVLAGPLVCATSQAVNDWFDREVDAINEPHRPIPSGRMPGMWGLWLAILWTCVSLAAAVPLGSTVVAATALGLLLAWAYSAPPARLKRNGWYGNTAVAFSYEGLAWVTGAALIDPARLWEGPILYAAVLYSIGAHGIMTLNDFKAIEGDRKLGIASLPVQLGVTGAARAACLFMGLPQIVVVGLLLAWGHPVHATVVALLLAGQLALMTKFLRAPLERATWFSGLGVSLYVLGMLATAFAIGSS